MLGRRRLALAVLAAGFVAGCHPTWDVARNGIPKFVAADFVDLASIERISRFRSAEGHDYSDSVEHCRSMKHYYRPPGEPGQAHDPPWATIAIRSPFDGHVDAMSAEQRGGVQLRLVPDAAPAFAVHLFHVAPVAGLAAGDPVRAGQTLGHLLDDDHYTDVAVKVWSGLLAERLVSYFDAMPDSLFAAYVARGATGRAQFIISRAERDADPLRCDGETFLDTGTLPSWVILR